MKEKYNVKIKEYDSQTTVSLYKNPVILRDELENAIIQLKRFRCSIVNKIVDLGDGNSQYSCNKVDLNNKIDEVIADKNLQDYYSYIKLLVPSSFISKTVNEYEKHNRSIISSLNRTKKCIYDYAYANIWSLFVTLTFDDTVLKKKYGKNASDYDVCVKCLHTFFTVLKRQCPEIQYLGVPELHHYFYDDYGGAVIYNGKKLSNEIYISLLNKSGRTIQEQDIVNKVLTGEYKRRFHFHFLFNNYPQKFLTDSSIKDKKGRIIYNLTNYKLGFTTATIIDSVEASQHYITKYISKDLIELSKGKKRYWVSKNLKKPVENKYDLDEEEFNNMDTDIANVIESDTRYKVISVENEGFKNKIYNGVVLNRELFKTDCLIDYIDLGVVRHFHYKTFSFRYENDIYNQHFTLPCFDVAYLAGNRHIPDRPMEYLIKLVFQELNKELKLLTGPTAFGKSHYVPEDTIYFTLDGVYGKAVLENGKYVYSE